MDGRLSLVDGPGGGGGVVVVLERLGMVGPT